LYPLVRRALDVVGDNVAGAMDRPSAPHAGGGEGDDDIESDPTVPLPTTRRGCDNDPSKTGVVASNEGIQGCLISYDSRPIVKN
jgi:hypothetical protein